MKPVKAAGICEEQSLKASRRPAAPQALLPCPDDTQFPTEDLAIRLATRALLNLQHEDGYWRFDLESDPGMTADYILMMHYMDEIDTDLQSKIAIYLREHQSSDGGWPLYYSGPSDLSCAVKTYYALKLAGDRPDLPHMKKARKMILSKGGAAASSVFVKITLALFRQVSWRGIPFLPVEIMLLPRWFPFHIQKVSYWSRTVMVPLFILCTLKPHAKNPREVDIAELFVNPSDQVKSCQIVRSPLNRLFLALDWFGKRLEYFIPRWVRQRALKKAERWIVERLNGTGGLGAIIPAMIGAYEALDCLGYPSDHPHRITAKQALEGLLVVGDRSAWCQTCLSPVWDTALSCLALQEVNAREGFPEVTTALRWLQQKQLLDDPGDWREYRPQLKGGGWAFEFQNNFYPDLDDTAAVAYAMYQAKDPCYQNSIQRAADWIAGMQSRNGGFASYDADNTYYYLNEIPFADHGALLDPPTSDVSARCLLFLNVLDPEFPQYRQARQACLNYLLKEQTPEGSWWGRWGTNYIYGTWSVLMALEAGGESPESPYVQRAVNWLKRVQRKDGGWGEDNDSYRDDNCQGQGNASTSYQTAWALLGLMSAGEVQSPEVRKGINYLLRTQKGDGLWKDDWFSAPGFPRVLYLKYGGYDKYFPLWALARYRNLCSPSH
jgi:squalene-hopene/tetraprenyl-beta-curcumene cyclase